MRSRFGGSFTGNFGKGLQCVWVGLLKSGVGYREERADRRLGLVSFVNLVRLDDMRSREIMGDRIWCAEVDFWRVKILVGWGLACAMRRREATSDLCQCRPILMSLANSGGRKSTDGPKAVLKVSGW